MNGIGNLFSRFHISVSQEENFLEVIMNTLTSVLVVTQPLLLQLVHPCVHLTESLLQFQNALVISTHVVQALLQRKLLFLQRIVLLCVCARACVLGSQLRHFAIGRGGGGGDGGDSRNILAITSAISQP